MKISLTEKRTPDEALKSEKVAFKSNRFPHGAFILGTGSTNQYLPMPHFESMTRTVPHPFVNNPCSVRTQTSFRK